LVNGGIIPTALAAKWLTDFWDQKAVLYVTSPIVSKLESIVEKWLIQLFGLPEKTVAGFVSGTSMAIFCGLAAARYRILKRLDWDENTILILQAGNVNTGSFDNFEKICKKANKAGSWIHIDGAFGLWTSS
jgi:glutamate/tyrosine decarboxylase-like PLP-dependent enzyme